MSMFIDIHEVNGKKLTNSMAEDGLSNNLRFASPRFAVSLDKHNQKATRGHDRAANAFFSVNFY
jgi:hypothetical protein